MARLERGDKAPPFTLPDHEGKPASFGDLVAKGAAVVYFYPADGTPGCTKEACQFNESLKALGRAGANVVGISPDGQSKHQRFREKHGLSFPLLSDPDHRTMEAYGAWGDKTMYGKKTPGVIRSTFIVDDGGTIRRAWYNVRADGHATKVLAELVTSRPR